MTIMPRLLFDAVRYIQDELNDEIFTGVGLMYPFTTAANLAGTEKILRAMRKDKENLRHLTLLLTQRLKLSTQVRRK